MPAAGSDRHHRTIDAAHISKQDNVIAGRMDNLQPVADLKPVLHVDQGNAVFAIQNISDILLATAFRMAAEVILLFVGMMALVKTIGVAAVRQRIQCA